MRKIVDIPSLKSEIIRLLVCTLEDKTYLFAYFKMEDGIADWEEVFEDEKEALEFCKTEFNVYPSEWIKIPHPEPGQSIDIIDPEVAKKLDVYKKSQEELKARMIYTEVDPYSFSYTN